MKIHCRYIWAIYAYWVYLGGGINSSIQSTDLYYQVPVSTQIVHEVVERIYHTRKEKPTYVSSHGLKEPPSDVVGFKKKYSQGCWVTELIVHGTNYPLMRPFSFMHTSLSHQVSKMTICITYECMCWCRSHCTEHKAQSHAM